MTQSGRVIVGQLQAKPTGVEESGAEASRAAAEATTPLARTPPARMRIILSSYHGKDIVLEEMHLYPSCSNVNKWPSSAMYMWQRMWVSEDFRSADVYSPYLSPLATSFFRQQRRPRTTSENTALTVFSIGPVTDEMTHRELQRRTVSPLEENNLLQSLNFFNDPK